MFLPQIGIDWEAEKEADWANYGGTSRNETIREKVYAAYRAAVRSARYMPSDPANARVITDYQIPD